MECRCIERSLLAFPRGYWRVVRKVIERTREGLDEKTFIRNVAELLPSFKMTRAGAFRGIMLDKNDVLRGDEFHVVDLCWKSVGAELCALKKNIDQNVRTKRSRVLIELSQEAEEQVIETTSRIFKQLSEITVKNKGGGQSKIQRVAASKILFAVLPEIALPVDTSEWKNVFCTKEDYGEILSTMISEIKEWEKMSKKKEEKLDETDQHPMTTLPAIYNVLAMAARPIQETNQGNRKQEGHEFE